MSSALTAAAAVSVTVAMAAVAAMPYLMGSGWAAAEAQAAATARGPALPWVASITQPVPRWRCRVLIARSAPISRRAAVVRDIAVAVLQQADFGTRAPWGSRQHARPLLLAMQPTAVAAAMTVLQPPPIMICTINTAKKPIKH
ncbi:hypothetical protein SDC9_150858 [bioreactor metagenome]|uniref:Uncharacterized protein n=1 Tax=bioreactor metagenome TaxID=1076179 RepID=A0A645EP88_9ZZZZ